MRSEITSSDCSGLFDLVPAFLGSALRTYADLMHQKGGALSNLRHLLLAVQRWKLAGALLARGLDNGGSMGTPSSSGSSHPIPEALVRAMCCLAWFYGWYSWVGATVLAFYGAGRLGEVLRCCREDLMLATDLLEAKDRPCFLKLRSFKSLYRQQARMQHMKVNDPVACKILHRLSKMPLVPLWRVSFST